MPIAFAGILMILGPIGAIAVVLLVPVLLVAMVWDTVASNRRERVSPKAAQSAVEQRLAAEEAAERRIFVKRGIARTFVVLGGVFWSIAAFAGLYWYRDTGAPAAFLAACIPLFATAVTLVVGWYWERLVAALLVLASGGVVYWMALNQFELGVWILVTCVLTGPMLTAAVLFWLARREQEALEFGLAHPELAYATTEK